LSLLGQIRCFAVRNAERSFIDRKWQAVKTDPIALDISPAAEAEHEQKTA